MNQFDLVVVHPFEDFKRGDRITDQSVVDAVLSGEHEHSVVKVPQEKREG